MHVCNWRFLTSNFQLYLLFLYNIFIRIQYFVEKKLKIIIFWNLIVLYKQSKYFE